MNHVIACRTHADGARFAMPPDWPELGQSEWARSRPDAHWLWVDRQAGVRARCSAWWTRVAPLAGERLGYLGHFAADDAMAGAQLLRHALAALRAQGATRALGPIDGSTWARYRFALESDGSPPFFLEPQQPAAWPGSFVAAGFAPWAWYRSALCEDLERPWRESAGQAQRLAARGGCRLRTVDLARWQEELRTLHRLSCAGFARGPLFTPIDESDFMKRYAALRPWIDPGLVWLAERDGIPAGFVFALPDHAQAAGGGPVDRVLIKSLMVLPAPGPAGLSLLLMRRVVQAARERGLRHAVLALMHEQNLSSRMAEMRMQARTFRRYALFTRSLS